MANGLCDVHGCQSMPLLGWRPLNEHRGWKICKQHWRRHLDEKDGFDLFEEFKFKRQVHIPRRQIKAETRQCNCGGELIPGHRFCSVCAEERERQRKKRAYHERKNQQQQSIAQENILQCRQCGRQRKPGYTYCPECAKHRKTITRRKAQSRYWKKQHNVAV